MNNTARDLLKLPKYENRKDWFSEIISSHCEIWIFVLDSQFFITTLRLTERNLIKRILNPEILLVLTVKNWFFIILIFVRMN